MTKNEIQTDRIQKYLQKLTLQARRHLLAEIERLQACGDDMPGSDITHCGSVSICSTSPNGGNGWTV